MTVGRTGFEPVKVKPADLQSAPFVHSGNHPNFAHTLLYIGECLSLKLIFDVAHPNLTYKSLTRGKNIAAVCQSV